MPAAPMYRPGERIDGPLADTLCAYGVLPMLLVKLLY